MAANLTDAGHLARVREMTRYVAHTVAQALAASGAHTEADGLMIVYGWLVAVRHMDDTQWQQMLAGEGDHAGH